MHTPEKESLVESYCPKGSFACLVPIGDIMLTNFVYLIQVKNRKTPGACSGVFSALLQHYPVLFCFTMDNTKERINSPAKKEKEKLIFEEISNKRLDMEGPKDIPKKLKRLYTPIPIDIFSFSIV